MPRKKSRKKAPTRRRRRGMGATGKTDLTQVLLAIGGGIAARAIVNIIPDDIGGTDITKFKPAIVLAGGYFLPTFVKNPMAKSFGMGMMVAGGVATAQSLGIIGAYESAPMLAGYERMLLNNSNGTGNAGEAPFVAGMGNTMATALFAG